MSGLGRHRSSSLAMLAFLLGCQPAAPAAAPLGAQEALSANDFAGLVDRISEEGGYFDTDNLISNESGYLNVLDALAREGVQGGAYVGVGPDQNYSYIAEIRPEIAFLTDVRRDNLLQHLLLKALVERAPTPVDFLAGLHGVAPPSPEAARAMSLDAAVAWVDSATTARTQGSDAEAKRLQQEVQALIEGYGVPLSASDYDTIRRFHGAFIRAGLGLRFTTFGRPPRPYYPTYRQLVLETDVDGDRASWLSSQERYDVVRALHLANRIVPVVGDMSGAHAVREMGAVMREMGLELSGFYTSNVEFYLWQGRTFDAWRSNLASLPTNDRSVVIRSYFPNFGGGHPSALPGYYATQTLQWAHTLREGEFRSYWDVVTRDVLPVR